MLPNVITILILNNNIKIQNITFIKPICKKTKKHKKHKKHKKE
jgi:hypothetical protein